MINSKVLSRKNPGCRNMAGPGFRKKTKPGSRSSSSLNLNYKFKKNIFFPFRFYLALFIFSPFFYTYNSLAFPSVFCTLFFCFFFTQPIVIVGLITPTPLIKLSRLIFGGCPRGRNARLPSQRRSCDYSTAQGSGTNSHHMPLPKEGELIN